jgi:hypothetical protein
MSGAKPTFAVDGVEGYRREQQGGCSPSVWNPETTICVAAKWEREKESRGKLGRLPPCFPANPFPGSFLPRKRDLPPVLNTLKDSVL